MKCKHCKSEMHGRKRQFCNKACRAAHLNESRRGVAKTSCIDCNKPCYGERCKPCRSHAQIKNWCTCGWCGTRFVKPCRGGAAGKYCCRDHAYAHKTAIAIESGKSRYHRQPIEKACDECGVVFATRRRHQTICSEACRKERARKATLALYRAVHPRTCHGCGVELSQHRVRLCVQCKGKRLLQQKRVERRASKAKRRARKRAVACELVRPLDVFSRDGYRCGICGKRCKQHATVPHPKAPTLDHIVPLSKGGEHTMKNVQCACFKCNTAKSNKAHGQMRLFG